MLNIQLKQNIFIKKANQSVSNPIVKEKVSFKGDMYREMDTFTHGKIDDDEFAKMKEDILREKSTDYDKVYTKELVKIAAANPKLPREEETELINKYQKDKNSDNKKIREEAYKAKDKVINSYTGAVLHFSKKYYAHVRKYGVSYTDLVNTAIVGLHNGIDKINTNIDNYSLIYYIRKSLYLSTAESKSIISSHPLTKVKAERAQKDYEMLDNPDIAETITDKDKEKITNKYINYTSLLNRALVDIDDSENPMQIADNVEEPESKFDIGEMKEDIKKILSVFKKDSQKEFFLFRLGYEMNEAGDLIPHGIKAENMEKESLSRFEYTPKSLRQTKYLLQQKLERSATYRQFMRKYYPKQALLLDIKDGKIDKDRTEKIKQAILSSKDINDNEKALIQAFYFSKDKNEFDNLVKDLDINYSNKGRILDRAVRKLFLPEGMFKND